MTFDAVYAAALGAVITVANGKPAPPAGTLRWKMWFSHNFSGPLLEKIEASETAPRAVRIEAVNTAAAQVSYLIADSGEHTFSEGGS